MGASKSFAEYTASGDNCLQAASNLGIDHLIMEIDALKVKQAWASKHEDFSVMGSLT